MTDARGWRRGAQAFEDMDPEQLMSGYHLAGGAHPGQHLASARGSWLQRHLADVHRQSGSLVGKVGGGGDHLRQKRAQITKQLLRLGSTCRRVCRLALSEGLACLLACLRACLLALPPIRLCPSARPPPCARMREAACPRRVGEASVRLRASAPSGPCACVAADARACKQPRSRRSGGRRAAAS